MNPPRETPVTVSDRDGGQHVIPGRTHRGLAMVRPYDLRVDPPALVPQRSAHPCWDVWHVPSGLSIGTVWGRVRAAWAEFCRIAEAADWDRPGPEVLVGPDCNRVHHEMMRAHRAELWGGL